MDKLNQEKIDQYLRHKMDEQTRQAFELELTSNEALREEVRLAKEAYEMLDAIGDQRMRATLDQIHEKIIENKPVAFSKKKVAAFLIGILILLGLSYYFFLAAPNMPAIDPQRAFLEHYENYPISLASRDDEQELMTQKINALYKNNNYQEALRRIEKLLDETTDTKFRMAAGISALEVGDYTKAFQYFDDLIERKDPFFQHQAMWYAAMTALKSEQVTLAKQYLQSLIDSGSSYKQEERQELLQKLK